MIEAPNPLEYWAKVVCAMRAEPSCEYRDGILNDMFRHAPDLDEDTGELVCQSCSMKWDVDAPTVKAPCQWLVTWGKRLEVEGWD